MKKTLNKYNLSLLLSSVRCSVWLACSSGNFFYVFYTDDWASARWVYQPLECSHCAENIFVLHRFMVDFLHSMFTVHWVTCVFTAFCLHSPTWTWLRDDDMWEQWKASNSIINYLSLSNVLVNSGDEIGEKKNIFHAQLFVCGNFQFVIPASYWLQSTEKYSRVHKSGKQFFAIAIWFGEYTLAAAVAAIVNVHEQL